MLLVHFGGCISTEKKHLPTATYWLDLAGVRPPNFQSTKFRGSSNMTYLFGGLKLLPFKKKKQVSSQIFQLAIFRFWELYGWGAFQVDKQSFWEFAMRWLNYSPLKFPEQICKGVCSGAFQVDSADSSPNTSRKIPRVRQLTRLSRDVPP